MTTKIWVDDQGNWNYQDSDVVGQGATYIKSIEDWGIKLRAKLGVPNEIVLSRSDMFRLMSLGQAQKFKERQDGGM